jgi:hypothetical protein
MGRGRSLRLWHYPGGRILFLQKKSRKSYWDEQRNKVRAELLCGEVAVQGLWPFAKRADLGSSAASIVTPPCIRHCGSLQLYIRRNELSSLLRLETIHFTIHTLSYNSCIDSSRPISPCQKTRPLSAIDQIGQLNLRTHLATTLRPCHHSLPVPASLTTSKITHRHLCRILSLNAAQKYLNFNAQAIT